LPCRRGGGVPVRGRLDGSFIQANIDRFKLLLDNETDPTKRAMEIRLLAEEEAKLRRLPKAEKKKSRPGA
jgi:hypothetical protein